VSAVALNQGILHPSGQGSHENRTSPQRAMRRHQLPGLAPVLVLPVLRPWIADIPVRATVGSSRAALFFEPASAANKRIQRASRG
jgi:hypothetical protein